MSDQTQSRYRWFLWLAVAIVCLAGFTFFVLSKPAKPAPVTFTADGNGRARLGGVPLLTTNLRDGTFAAMAALGIKAQLSIPSPPTNKTQESNLLETLQSMNRAGLFSTNQPPNPYE